MLEGPEANPQDLNTSQRLRGLAAMLRDLKAEADRRWMEQRQQQRETEAEQKRQLMVTIEAELARRGIDAGSHPRRVAA